MGLADVRGPILGGIVKENVTLIVLGQHRVILKGIGLKFGEEQVLHTDLGKNSMRIYWPE
jgi:hypothetical protein